MARLSHTLTRLLQYELRYINGFQYYWLITSLNFVFSDWQIFIVFSSNTFLKSHLLILTFSLSFQFAEFFYPMSCHHFWTIEHTSPKIQNIRCVKSVRIRSFFGPYFRAFGLNTEIHRVNLPMQSNAWKYESEKLRIGTLFTQWWCLQRCNLYLHKQLRPIPGETESVFQ